MLTELYRYALDHGLAAQPGFKPKRVKAYVLLSADGKFLGVHVREKDAPAVYAPDIGAAANGTRYCNPLIEKAKIPLGIVEDPKGDKMSLQSMIFSCLCWMMGVRLSRCLQCWLKRCGIKMWSRK